MKDHLLRRKEVAAMLGTTEGVAVSILEEHGVYAIDFGYGRGRGPRWPESQVLAVIRNLYEKAQPKAKVQKTKIPKVPELHLADMSVKEIQELIFTGRQPVQ